MEAQQPTSNKPLIGYWTLRGLGASIRYQLAYLGVDYDLQEYTLGDAPDFNPAEWADKKFTLGLPFPNIPYVIHGDVKLTESMAIHRYFAELYDTTLLGKSAKDKAHVEMLSGIIEECNFKCRGPMYMSGDINELTAVYEQRLPPILAFKGNNPFLVGDYPTYMDFYFFEVVELLKCVTEGAVFKKFPELESFCVRMKGLKGLKEYLADPNCRDAKYAFNNKMAKLNGTQGFN